jgi:hypothetical protein
MYYPPSAPPPSSKSKRRMCDDSEEYGREDDESKRCKPFAEVMQCEGMAMQGVETASSAAIGAQTWRTATTNGAGLNGGWPKYGG